MKQGAPCPSTHQIEAPEVGHEAALRDPDVLVRGVHQDQGGRVVLPTRGLHRHGDGASREPQLEVPVRVQQVTLVLAGGAPTLLLGDLAEGLLTGCLTSRRL